MPKSRQRLGALEAPLGASIRLSENSLYIHDEFRSQPLFAASTDGFSNPVGTANATNIMYTGKNMLEYNIKGTATQVAPTWDTDDGLELSLDQANNEGLELTPGGQGGSRGQGVFVVGADEGLQAVGNGNSKATGHIMRATLTLDNVAGADEVLVGIRNAVGGYQAAFASYTDFAALNINAGNIESITRLNSGSVTTTAPATSTATDDVAITLEVRMSPSGGVTWFVNGVRQTDLEDGFQFDSGDSLIPFLWFVNDTGLSGALLTLWESGSWRTLGVDDAVTRLS